jgi:hypothetical protein
MTPRAPPPEKSPPASPGSHEVHDSRLSGIDPDEVFWFGQEQGVLVQRSIDADRLYRSSRFPGLWLDPQALMKGDRQRLRAVVDLGCATPEHAAFVKKLADSRSVESA